MRAFITISIITLLLLQKVYGSGFAIWGAGSDGTSISGACRAIEGEPGAIFWNPSCISGIQNKIIDIALITVFPEIRYIPMTGIVGYDGGYSQRRDIYSEKQIFYIPSMFIGFPTEHFDVAFGMFYPFGLGSQFDLYELPLGFRNPYKFPGIDWKSDLKVITWATGIGKNIKDISLGGSFGLTFGEVILSKVNLIPANPEDPGSIPLPYSYLPMFVEINEKGTGIYFSLGLLSRIGEKTKIGISGKYFSPINFSGTTKLSLYSFDSTLTGNKWILETTAQSKTKLKLPYEVGAGFSYKSSPTLSFFGDLSITFWSVLDSLILELNGYDFTGNPLPNEVLIRKWKNTFRYALGFEYFYKENLSLNGGFYYDATPIPLSSTDPLIPDISPKLSFTGSLNYHLNFGWLRTKITLGGELINFEDRVVPKFEDVNNDGKNDNMPGIYSAQIGTIILGLSFEY